MAKQVQNRFGDTALDFLVSRIVNDMDKINELISDDEAGANDMRRYEVLEDFLDMIRGAKQDFENSLQVEPDPMLDSQLG